MPEYEEWAEERGVTRLPLRQTEPARISMEDYGAELADVVAQRAACTRRQVGAVIIGPDKRIIATGYNGVAPGKTECVDGGCPRGAFSHDEIAGGLGNGGHAVPCIAQHAEINAIDWAEAHELDLTGATIFITCAPCPDCAEKCAEAGLRVVHP